MYSMKSSITCRNVLRIPRTGWCKLVLLAQKKDATAQDDLTFTSPLSNSVLLTFSYLQFNLLGYIAQLGSLEILNHYFTVCATSKTIALLLSQRGSYTKDDMHDSEWQNFVSDEQIYLGQCMVISTCHLHILIYYQARSQPKYSGHCP